MGLNVWLADDLTCIITAVTVAAVQGSTASGVNVEYLRGVLHHSRAVALAFGVWPDVREVLACLEDGDIMGLLPGGER